MPNELGSCRTVVQTMIRIKKKRQTIMTYMMSLFTYRTILDDAYYELNDE